MEEIIFNRPTNNQENLVGEFTFFCDTFAYISESYFSERRQKGGFCTYVLEVDTYRPNFMAIRFPGATRGHIEIDENSIIKDIVFYEDSGIAKKEPNNVGIYKEEIIDAVKKFIGRKIIIQ